MKKRFIAALLCAVISLALCVPANADGKDGHDEIMSSILFGSATYEDGLTEGSKEQKALVALENAVAICLDQYNGEYVEELKALKNMHIHGIPDSIDAVDFKGNQHHRRYTHRGWNFVYPDDKAHWGIRKELLLQTVNKVFGFQTFAGKWEVLGKEVDRGYTEQCVAFAELLYYIHVLEDIPHSKKTEGYDDLIKLALAHPQKDSPDIYMELLEILPIIFSSQTGSSVYSGLIADIKLQARETRRFVSDTPDLLNNYTTYQEAAQNLIDKLKSKLPALLEEEPFFKNVFYSSKNGAKAA